MGIHLKNVISFLVILILGISSFAYAMFQGGFVSWFVFYSFILLFSYSFTLLFYQPKWVIERLVHGHAIYSGDQAVITMTCARRIPFLLVYMMIEDVVPDSLYLKSTPKQLTFPLFKRKLTYSYVIDKVHRGEHEFSEVKMMTGDLFGLVTKEVVVPVKTTILIYPAMRNTFFSRRMTTFGDTVAASKVNHSFETLMVAGVREYQAGDKLSLVDWKATARKQTIMTKEFEAEQSQDIVILLDCSSKQSNEDFEMMVACTASLANFFLKNRVKFELVAVSEVRQQLVLKKGKESIYHVLHMLARIKAVSELPFAQILLEERNRRGHLANFILLSNSISSDLLSILRSFDKDVVTVVSGAEHLGELEKCGISVLHLNDVMEDVKEDGVNTVAAN